MEGQGPLERGMEVGGGPLRHVVETQVEHLQVALQHRARGIDALAIFCLHYLRKYAAFPLSGLHLGLKLKRGLHPSSPIFICDTAETPHKINLRHTLKHRLLERQPTAAIISGAMALRVAV